MIGGLWVIVEEDCQTTSPESLEIPIRSTALLHRHFWVPDSSNAVVTIPASSLGARCDDI